MTTAGASSVTTPRAAWPFILAGGAIAGSLDIVFACVFWALKANVPSRRILQSVAAGLLGSKSFDGGTATAALGLFLQYLIAVSMAVVYYLVARRWSPVRRRPLLFGGGYGLVLYAVMNGVVVPLSAASPGSRDPAWIGLSVAVHVLFVGIPIALSIRNVFPN